MKDVSEIEEAGERAAKMQRAARKTASRYYGMTYEDGLRDALDWVCENVEEDPTNEA
jgi:hypothetical protein